MLDPWKFININNLCLSQINEITNYLFGMKQSEHYEKHNHVCIDCCLQDIASEAHSAPVLHSIDLLTFVYLKPH